MRIRILGLLCVFVLLGPLHAAEPTPGDISPTMQDMVRWKGQVLSRYDDVVYLDTDARRISEDIFFFRIVAEKRGFNMRTDSSAPKRITVRLLSDAEQKAAQPGMK